MKCSVELHSVLVEWEAVLRLAWFTSNTGGTTGRKQSNQARPDIMCRGGLFVLNNVMQGQFVKKAERIQRYEE
jgi:hypothetical protein